MRLQEYGRNPHTRKAYVQQHDLLMVRVDVSKATHHACLGTQLGIPFWGRFLKNDGTPSSQR
jgi:hypothetical protein